MDLEDLIALGYTGILQARLTFDAGKGYGWKQHAYWRTYGSMVDGARQWSHYSHCRTLFRRDQRRAISVDSTCAAVSGSGMAPEQGPQPSTISIEMLPDPNSVHEELGLAEKDMIRRIGWLATYLPMEQRVILELHYHFEMTMAEIGELFGHSKSWVSRKHSSAISELRRLVENPGAFMSIPRVQCKADEPPHSSLSNRNFFPWPTQSSNQS